MMTNQSGVGKESRAPPGRSKSAIIFQNLKDTYSRRKGERWYRFLHYDLDMTLKIGGSMVAVFHTLYVMAVLASADDCEWNPLQKFTNGLKDVVVGLVFCANLGIKRANFLHAVAYLWIALNFFAVQDNRSKGMKAGAVFFGALSSLWCVVVFIRQTLFHFYSPRLYKAFQQHASLDQFRGVVLFYRDLRDALYDAGIMVALDPSENRRLHRYLNLVTVLNADNANPLTGGPVHPEDVFLTFDQFADLYDVYIKDLQAASQASLNERQAMKAPGGGMTGILPGMGGMQSQGG